MEHAKFYVGHEGRQVFWNVENFEAPLFIFAAVALAVMAYGIYQRRQLWKAIGKPEVRNDNIPQRLKLFC